MKKQILAMVLAVVMIMALATTAMAASVIDSGTCGDNLTWTLDSDGTLTISGTGEMWNWSPEHSVPWYSRRTSIKAVNIENSVTSIGSDAFSYCYSLTSITIPNSVTSIWGYAFSACKSLTSITIPNSVTSIGNGAFYDCDSLTSVTIPDSVTWIGWYAFESCDSLVSITMPDSVTSIEFGAFSVCKSLTSITIPNSVTSIEVQAFHGCKSLTSITMPDSVMSINGGAFQYCDSLADVYYGGSEADWAKIDIGIDNDCLKNAKIHYNSYYAAEPEEKETDFALADGYCVENETGYLSGNLEISGGDIESAVSGIKWASSDETVAEVGEVGYVNSVDGKSSVIDVEIIGHKIGKAKITGTTVDGQKAEATVSVEPKLEDKSSITISNATTIKYAISTDSSNRAYFKEFLSSLSYETSGTFSAGITVKSSGYTIAGDGKSAVYEFEVEPKTSMADSYIEITSKYGQKAKIPVRYEKGQSGFSIQNDGWSFANSEFSFSGEHKTDFSGNTKNEYVMPMEIYEKVYGSSYIEANDIETGELFGGYCQGMSDTAILFYDGLLDWSDIDDSYDEDFGTVNSYYDAIAYHNKLSPKYYVTSNPNTKVTELIECYQLWGNHVGDKSQSSTFDELDKTYFKEGVKQISGFFGNKRELLCDHVAYENGGTYVEDALERIKQAVNNDRPLIVELQYQDGAHAIVARTDKAPEDEGNGWWKVFVYDPNKPYVNDSILDIIRDADSDYRLLQNSCNDLLASGEDCYMELNPRKNLWRYGNHGLDNNEAKTMKNDIEDEDGEYTLIFPEWFCLYDPADYCEGTFDDPNRSWLPRENEDTITVPVNNATNFEIYSSDHELLAAAADGYGISLDNSIKFYPYTNAAEGSGATTGELVLPKDEYEFVIDSGTLRVWGHDNVINLTAEAGATAVIDIEKNKVDVTADDDGEVKILLSNVESADECDTYKIECDLEEGENVSAELPEESDIIIDADTNIINVEHNDRRVNRDVKKIGRNDRFPILTDDDIESWADVNMFFDVPRYGYYREAVNCLAGLGIITGYEDGSFRPNNTITRAETAAIMTRLMDLEQDAGRTPFTDVPSGHWAAGYVNAAYDEGIINGMGDGTFQPGAEVTYEQIVKMLVCAMGKEDEAAACGGYPKGYLSIAEKIGFTDGVSGTIGQPADRATVVRLVYNAIIEYQDIYENGDDYEYYDNDDDDEWDGIIYEL